MHESRNNLLIVHAFLEIFPTLLPNSICATPPKKVPFALFMTENMLKEATVLAVRCLTEGKIRSERQRGVTEALLVVYAARLCTNLSGASVISTWQRDTLGSLSQSNLLQILVLENLTDFVVS